MPTRRQLLATVGSATTVLLAGCLDELTDALDDEDEDENLQQQWEENDDYPDDDFRNFAVAGGFGMGLGGRAIDSADTTFGTHVEPIQSGKYQEYHTSPSAEIQFQASKPVDVYLIPDDVVEDFYDNKDLTEFEYIHELSQFDVESYHEVLHMEDDEDAMYTLIVTLAGITPPQTIEEEFEFMDEHTEAELEGSIEHAVYIPFEEYKENESARFAYDDFDPFDEDD